MCIRDRHIPVVVGLAEGLDGSDEGLRLLSVVLPGGGRDAGDFDLADEGVCERGLALLKQGTDLPIGFRGAAAVGVVLRNLLEAAVDGGVFGPGGACLLYTSKMPDTPRSKDPTTVTVNVYIPDLNYR